MYEKSHETKISPQNFPPSNQLNFHLPHTKIQVIYRSVDLYISTSRRYQNLQHKINDLAKFDARNVKPTSRIPQRQRGPFLSGPHRLRASQERPGETVESAATRSEHEQKTSHSKSSESRKRRNSQGLVPDAQIRQ